MDSVMEFHEAANIFPIDDDNIPELAADIKAQKQQVPIEMMGGKVLDGRRRWLAYKLAGITPITREVNPADPIAYVMSLNLHRRHLSPTQASMVGARAKEIYDKQAKERKVEGGKSAGKGRPKDMENFPHPMDSGTSRDLVGKAVGVSGKSIDFATRVLNNGIPELIAAVDSDKLAVSTASKIASRPHDEQKLLVARADVAARRPRPATEVQPDDSDSEGEEVKRKGVGVIRANEAINSLSRIPKNDALRKRGFQIVTDWIKANK
jgi:hypothetical protein